MEKKLEDYLHLYLRCDVMWKDKVYELEGVDYSWQNPVRLRRGETVTARKPEQVKPILRPLSDITDIEVNEVCSIMLNKETTCGRIWRSEEKDFIIATFKQEKPLPPYDKNYKSMSMGVYIKNNCQVDYKWSYYIEENCEGSCGITTEPLHNHNEITRYLLSKHFDLFNLIDAGLAIDKTKLKP